MEEKIVEAIELIIEEPLSTTEETEVEKQLRGFIIRPLKYFKELKRIRRDSTHARAWLKQNNLSKLTMKDLEFLYKHKRNAVICVLGDPGDGKSVTAKSLALICLQFAQQYVNPNARIYLSFSNAETLQIVDKLQPGDIILQDEIKRETGEDSRITKAALLNVEEQVRENQNTFIFVSPTLKGFEAASTHIFEPIGYFQESNNNSHNVVKFYDANLVTGHCFISRRSNKDFEEEYRKRKKANVDLVLKTRGLATVAIDLDQVKKDASTVLKGLESEFGNNFINVRAKILPLFVRSIGIVGSGAYIKYVAQWTQIELEKLRLAEDSRESNNENFTLGRQEEEFSKFFFDYATEALVQDRKFSNQHTAKRFSLYYVTTQRRLTWVDVRETLGEKELPDSIRKYVRERRLSNTYLGNLLEKALQQWLNSRLGSSQDIPLVRESGAGHCDLHLSQHKLCLNCKFRLEEKAAQTEHCSPEYHNASQNNGESFVAQWSKGFGLRLFKATSEYVPTGSSEEISLETLLAKIKALA